jgi:GT2 family glycosyltransferase
MMGPAVSERRIGVVVATRNRTSLLLATLERLTELPEKPPIVVVDNASEEVVPEEVRRRWTDVELVSLGRNLGPAARTVGAERIATPYVAFSDNDSWWAPGALARAADLFDRHRRLGLVQARILVGEEGVLDPACATMSRSPLGRADGLAEPALLGFVACGAIVRREAFLDVGGFDRRFRIGGEEEIVALDLASSGWDLAYVDSIVAHHHPSGERDHDLRRRSLVFNGLVTAWMRRPVGRALEMTWDALRQAARDPQAAAGTLEALGACSWVLARRRPVADDVEARLRLLEGHR